MLNVRKNSKTTVGIYTRVLRVIMNEALERRLLHKDAYPFGRRKYLVPTGRNIKKAISKDVLSKLYYAELESESQEKARDFWFFSFNGNGMNVADIIKLKYKNLSGEYLSFERTKTELTSRGRDAIVITCHLNDDIRQTIEKWGNKDKSPDNFIFPIISYDNTELEVRLIKQNFVQFINKNMKKICKIAGVEIPIRTMEARHTFSTILKNSGVSPHYVKEALGHTSLQTTENYLAGFEDEYKKKASEIINDFKHT